MGLLSSKKTYNTYNTGLGDDQYSSLFDQGQGLGSQISDGFTGANNRFDQLDTSLSGVNNQVVYAGGVIYDRIDEQFRNQNNTLDAGFKDSQNNQSYIAQNQITGFTDLNALNEDRFNSLQDGVSGVQTSVDTGFSDTATANQNIQTAVDTGFSDQAQGFANTQGLMTDNTADIRGDITSNFDATNKSLGDAQTNIQGDIAASQREVLDGQGGLSSSITNMSDTNDTYFGSLSDGQGNLQTGLDGFRTTFDTYVDRYSDDTTLANQTRADLQLAQSNAAKALRTDIGNYAQASAQGQDNINRNIGTLGEGSARGFEVLADTVQGGFSDTTAANQLESQNLSSRIGNVKSLLQTTGETIDATSREQYTALVNSFDENGQLIANSVDAQGNTISRAMDDQGRIIETKFDGTGNEIGKVQMDVETMLSNAEQYQSSLTGQISGLQEVTEGGFTGVDSALGTGFADTEREIISGVESLGQETSAGLTNLQSVLNTGFDTQSGTLSQQAKQILGVAQNIEQFDAGNRSQFAEIASAFDDQGNLIQNSTDSLGNTILRQLDVNGNLITQRLDQNGNVLETSNSNVSDALTAIQQQTGSLSDRIQLGFSDIDRGQQDLTNTVQTGQQGLMAETVNTQDMLGTASQQLRRGFDETSGTLDIQTRDLANIASGQSDLDIRMRQDFKQVSNAFDDQGLLITNTVADNGTTISRAVDQNGNLLLRAFDAQGNRIGDKVLNINRTLFDLQNLQTQTGGNVSMGNLSAPMQGEIPTSGFASPFTTTR